jgi:phosphoesterase RecJ-like protein
MKNDSAKDILKRIKFAKRILIPLHGGPDGDSLGCCAAAKYWLERDFHKEVKLISKDSVGETLSQFNFVKDIEFGKGIEDIDLTQFDLILFLDHGVPLYSINSEITLQKDSVINIDHHETNTYFGDLNYVNPKRPSGCSILLDLFREWKIKFDRELATRLLLGIYTDSGEFSHDKGDALKDAVFLIDKNANYLEGIVNVIKYNIPFGIKKYHALLIDNFRVVDFDGYKVGVSCTSLRKVIKLGINLSEIRSGPNYLQEIGGLDFLFTLAEMEDKIKGSFRSRKKINVSLFAKELGGGGHKLAAAFNLPKMPLKRAEKKVFDAIKKIGIHKIE